MAALKFEALLLSGMEADTTASYLSSPLKKKINSGIRQFDTNYRTPISNQRYAWSCTVFHGQANMWSHFDGKVCSALRPSSVYWFTVVAAYPVRFNKYDKPASRRPNILPSFNPFPCWYCVLPSQRGIPKFFWKICTDWGRHNTRWWHKGRHCWANVYAISLKYYSITGDTLICTSSVFVFVLANLPGCCSFQKHYCV